MRLVLTARALWNGSRRIADPVVVVEDGRIVQLTTRAEAELPKSAYITDFPEATLAPTLVDVHTHGCAGHDVMDATPQAMLAIGGFLARRGTGGYLATTVTAPLDATLRSLERLAGLIENPVPGARPLGIHLEGPFLSHGKRGVHPPEHLQAPDIALFDKLFQAARGHVSLMTLAPELPGAIDLAAHATQRGVRISLGHSNATAAETRAAIQAGAVSATHTFNAMRPLDHREPGILGEVLANDGLFAEILCDGIHVDPAVVQLWWRAKGPARGLLVTDAMSAAGMPDGEYELGGIKVQVANGRAMAGGVLAGSVLTLDRAVANCMAFSGAPLEDALRMATVNPASMAGLRAGTLAVGESANLIAVDARGKLLASVIHGIQVL